MLRIWNSKQSVVIERATRKFVRFLISIFIIAVGFDYC